MQVRTGQERFLRALLGVVGASALVYPMLLCAVQVAFNQLLAPDVSSVVVWLSLGVLCSVALVGALRWAAGRRVRSAWLLAGLAIPAAFELWLVWPLIAG
jgi:hypothetical protein